VDAESSGVDPRGAVTFGNERKSLVSPPPSSLVLGRVRVLDIMALAEMVSEKRRGASKMLITQAMKHARDLEWSRALWTTAVNVGRLGQG
jgi:hypothetical protein